VKGSRGEIIELELDSLAFGGEAVGRQDDGRVVFVAGGAPGDRVSARIVDSKRSFARAELVTVLEPGATRVTPPCPYVAQCGGCPWQHVAAEAQLLAKQEIVRRALAKSGAEVRPIAGAPAWLGYRTRARMSARGSIVGFSGRRSHTLVAIDGCVALDPALDRALQLGRRTLGPLLGEDGALLGLSAGDRVHLAVEPGAGSDGRGLGAAAARLLGQEGIVGVLVRGQPPVGEALLAVDGHRGSAAGFAQANRAQNERLRALVSKAARPAGARVLELYAGDGNFTRDLAALAAEGVAVEGDAEACARLRINLGHPRWTVRQQPAGRAADELAAAHSRFDVVVLDPPRAGAAEALAGIARLAPERIVYVSCDPMTLARDLERLSNHGFLARVAWPVDMMPHTSHVEVVCLVTPAASRA
jgi:23S rRNA (uracil1939-C5)-methyltransferase